MSGDIKRILRSNLVQVCQTCQDTYMKHAGHCGVDEKNISWIIKILEGLILAKSIHPSSHRSCDVFCSRGKPHWEQCTARVMEKIWTSGWPRSCVVTTSPITITVYGEQSIHTCTRTRTQVRKVSVFIRGGREGGGGGGILDHDLSDEQNFNSCLLLCIYCKRRNFSWQKIRTFFQFYRSYKKLIKIPAKISSFTRQWCPKALWTKLRLYLKYTMQAKYLQVISVITANFLKNKERSSKKQNCANIAFWNHLTSLGATGELIKYQAFDRYMYCDVQLRMIFWVLTLFLLYFM